MAAIDIKHGVTVSFATACTQCGKDYGNRAWILFSYCLQCNALMCCVTDTNRAKGVCGRCKIEDSAA